MCAIALSALVVAGALFPDSPLRDVETSSAPTGSSLRFPASYILLAPLCDVMDAMSILTLRQHVAMLLSITACFLIALGIAVRRGGWRPLSLARAAAWFLLAAAGFYVTMLLAPRPMSALSIQDSDVVTIDFHSHTEESWDARTGFDAERNRAWHRSAGFDVSYIADHSDDSAPEAADRLNPAEAGGGTMILKALERRTSLGHAVILGEDATRMDLLTVPIDLREIESLASLDMDRVVAIEASDGAPRGLDEGRRDRARILALADRHGLALVAGTNNHGWGRTANAWSLMRIPGWRGMTAADLDAAIRETLRTQRRRAVRVIERASPAPGSTSLALAATAPLVGWNMLRALSAPQRMSWLAWIWAAAATAAVLEGRRRRDARALTDAGRWRWAAALAVAVACGRLAMATTVPLAPQEASSWEWSRLLAAGSLDQAPVVAYLVRAGVALLGIHPIGVRLVSILAGLAGALAIIAIARRLDRAAPLRASAILACMPLAATGFTAATPDAPLIALEALSILSMLLAIEAPPARARALFWWTLSGIALGGALASRITALALPLGAAAAFLASGSLRAKLRTAGPWVACAAAAVVCLPLAGASLRGGSASALDPARRAVAGREASVLADPIFWVSPILLAMMALAVVEALRRRERGDRFLLGAIAAVSAAPALALVAFVPAAPGAAGAQVCAIALLATASGGARWRGWLRAGCALGAVSVGLVYLQGIYPAVRVTSSLDPAWRAYGWKRVAHGAASAAAQIDPPGSGRMWFGADSFEEASELAFHVPQHPFVFALDARGPSGPRGSWEAFHDAAGEGDGLVLVLPDGGGPPAALDRLAPRFEKVRADRRIELRRGRHVFGARRIWILTGWKGDSDGRPQKEARDAAESPREGS